MTITEISTPNDRRSVILEKLSAVHRGDPVHPDERPDWHDLDQDEKQHEHELQGVSVYFDHPDFEPVYCATDGVSVFREESGECPWGSGHEIGGADWMERAA